jgi:hypothetical protein
VTKLRPDHPFMNCAAEIAKRAKELARVNGHPDSEAIIVCSDGVRTGIEVEVWWFYIAEATAPDLGPFMGSLLG